MLEEEKEGNGTRTTIPPNKKTKKSGRAYQKQALRLWYIIFRTTLPLMADLTRFSKRSTVITLSICSLIRHCGLGKKDRAPPIIPSKLSISLSLNCPSRLNARSPSGKPSPKKERKKKELPRLYGVVRVFIFSIQWTPFNWSESTWFSFVPSIWRTRLGRRAGTYLTPFFYFYFSPNLFSAIWRQTLVPVSLFPLKSFFTCKETTQRKKHGIMTNQQQSRTKEGKGE